MARKYAQQALALTEMDLAILDALTIDPFASARAVADTLGAPVAKVTARLRAMDRHRVSQVRAVLDLAAAGQKICFVQLEVRGRTTEAIAAEIGLISEVVQISTLIGGPHDMLILLRFDTVTSLQNIVANRLGRIDGIHGCVVSIVLDIPVFQPRYVLIDAGQEPVKDVAEIIRDLAREFPEDQLDELDRIIVAELLLDARQSINSIARKYKINASTIRYRARGLEGRGLIHFITLLDPPALGFQVYALVEIEPKVTHLADVIASLRATSLLSQIFVTTGAAPIKGIIHGEDLNAIRRIRSEKLAQIDGVNSVTVSVFIGTHKMDLRWGYKHT